MEVRILIKETGVYVEDPKLDRDYINDLKDALEKMGAFEIEDSDIIRKIKEKTSPIVLILPELPENHDAGITFKKSEDNPSQIVATIIPPNGTGKPLTIHDINDRIEMEGLTAISVIADNLLEAIKKQASETGNFSFVLGEFPPPLIKVDVTGDEMSAYLTIKKFREGQQILAEDILSAIQNAHVIKGIVMDKIHELAERNQSVESELVARGLPPVDGENGEIIYYFDAKKEHKGPQIDLEGKADYHHLNLFENIKKGDLLCQVIPPKEGKAGFKVTGAELPAKTGRECIMPQGQNTEIDSADTSKLISSIEGSPKLAGGRVIVESIMNIRGDIGVGTGDIHFLGTLQISGGVNDGFSAKVKGDILINGPCGAASITAEGNVILQKGMRSNENGFISAGGEVHAAFLEGVTINAGGDVIVRDYCYHCNIKSNKSIKVLGKKGFITGGRLEAKEHMITRRLGSSSCTKTEILLDPCSDMNRTTSEPIPISNHINYNMDTSKEASAENANTQNTDENALDPQEPNYIAVVDTVHPGVVIIIKNGKTVTTEELAGVKFICKLGRIEMYSYEHEEKQE